MAQSKHKRNWIIWTIVVVVVVLAIAAGVRILYQKTASTSAQSSGPYLHPQAGPLVVNTPAVPAEPEPGATRANQPQVSPSLHFSVTLPPGWDVKFTDTEALITAPDKTRYSIQSYPSSSNDNQALGQFLATRSNLHNILAVPLLDHNGFVFDIDGPYRHGAALLLNSRLYYFLGSGIETSPIFQTFKPW